MKKKSFVICICVWFVVCLLLLWLGVGFLCVFFSFSCFFQNAFDWFLINVSKLGATNKSRRKIVTGGMPVCLRIICLVSE